jgi:hypothetical protein
VAVVKVEVIHQHPEEQPEHLILAVAVVVIVILVRVVLAVLAYLFFLFQLQITQAQLQEAPQ